MSGQAPAVTGTWSAGALRAAVGGRWSGNGFLDHDVDALDMLPIRGASIDSREVVPGQVFFACPGERTDGHAFVGQAAAAGASLVVVSDPEAIPDADRAALPVLVVPDVVSAMTSAASAFRERLSAASVIAVTGSNGKTTAVRYIVSVLRAAGWVVSASVKSHNNRLGVSLTLLNADPASDAVVCEVGTSRPGEIAALGAIVRPSVAVLTMVGHAHLEGLGSVRGVAAEKADLLRSVLGGGTAVINAEARHPEIVVEAVASHASRVLVGSAACEHADLRYSVRSEAAEGVVFDLAIDGEKPWRCQTPLLGAHNALNAALAAAVAITLNVDRDAIVRGIAGVEAAPMRLACAEVGGLLVVNDAYNANPDSMLGALMTFDRLAGDRRRVIVLGDMREMGEAEQPAHRELGAVSLRVKPSVAVCVGPASKHTARGLLDDANGGEGVSAVEVRWQPELDVQAVLELLRPGDAVLLKGSRAIGLERVAAAITAQSSSSAAV